MMVEAMRQEKGAEMMQLEQQLELLKQQIAKDAEELKDHKDMNKYDKVAQTRFTSFLCHVRDTPDPSKTAKPSIAIMGNRGVGKSSTCNALTGGEYATTGVEDETLVVTQVYGTRDDHKFEVWDVPGETDTRSYANLQHLLQMKTMHVVIVQYTESIKMALNLVRLTAACRLPMVIVRNKADLITEKDAKKAKMSLEEMRKQTQSNEEKTLKAHLQECEGDVGDAKVSIIYAATGDGPEGLGVMTIKRVISDLLGQDVLAS